MHSHWLALDKEQVENLKDRMDQIEHSINQTSWNAGGVVGLLPDGKFDWVLGAYSPPDSLRVIKYTRRKNKAFRFWVCPALEPYVDMVEEMRAKES